MEDIKGMVLFLQDRKEQYLKRAEWYEEKEKGIRKTILNNEKAYSKIPGHPKAIIPDEHGREQLTDAIVSRNQLLAKVELIEELQEMERMKCFNAVQEPEPCIIKGIKPAVPGEGYCLGYKKSEDEEPCEMCQTCRRYELAGE